MSYSGKLGNKKWLIADGFLPEIHHGSYLSHESICVLNIGEKDANLTITFYFEDREPMKNFRSVCKAERTNHIRLDTLTDETGQKLPVGVPYAIRVISDEPVIVQHTRLDTTQPELSLMTTMACPLE